MGPREGATRTVGEVKFRAQEPPMSAFDTVYRLVPRRASSAIDVVRADDGSSRVNVKAELDLALAPVLQQRLAEAAAAGELVIVDLSRCLYIDSTGVATLLNASRRLTRSRAALAVVCPNPTPLRVFEITKTVETLNVAATEQEALTLAHNWRGQLQKHAAGSPG